MRFVAGVCRSPGLRRQLAPLVATETFQQVSDDPTEATDVDICRKEVDRMPNVKATPCKCGRPGKGVQCASKHRHRTEIPTTIQTLYVETDGTGIPTTPNDAPRPPKRTTTGR